VSSGSVHPLPERDLGRHCDCRGGDYEACRDLLAVIRCRSSKRCDRNTQLESTGRFTLELRSRWWRICGSRTRGFFPSVARVRAPSRRACTPRSSSRLLPFPTKKTTGSSKHVRDNFRDMPLGPVARNPLSFCPTKWPGRELNPRHADFQFGLGSDVSSLART
jgi:hypothetical protein